MASWCGDRLRAASPPASERFSIAAQSGGAHAPADGTVSFGSGVSAAAPIAGTWEDDCNLGNRKVVTVIEQPGSRNTALWTRTAISYDDHACNQIAGGSEREQSVRAAAAG
jgi:hypothetical protein